MHVPAEEMFHPCVIVATIGPPLPICRGPDTADVDIADSVCVLSSLAAAPAGADTGYYSQACILLAQPFLISICAAHVSTHVFMTNFRISAAQNYHYPGSHSSACVPLIVVRV